MAILPIVTVENPVLRQKAKRIKRLDDRLQALIDDMIDTMRAANGVGLAAPQVGVSLRLIVIEIPEDTDDPNAGQLFILYNPEVVKTSGEYEVEEGCLSLPGYVATVKRSEKVTAKGRDPRQRRGDRNGKEVRIKGEGLLGHALQHEIDHINGILYIDHLSSLDELRKVEPRSIGVEPGRRRRRRRTSPDPVGTSEEPPVEEPAEA